MPTNDDTFIWPPFCGDEYPNVGREPETRTPMPPSIAARIMVCTKDIHDSNTRHESDIHKRAWNWKREVK